MAGAPGATDRANPKQNCQGQSLSDPDVDGRSATLPVLRNRRSIQPAVGDRIRLSGNETDTAQQQLHAAQQNTQNNRTEVVGGYNFLRYQMMEMSRHCPGIYLCEMSLTSGI